MLYTFRLAFVALLIGSLTINPACAYYGMDCGCYEPEPPCCSACECAAMSCESAPTAEPVCCGEATMPEAHPAQKLPQKAPAQPNVTKQPVKPEPKSMETPAAKPPVTMEQPAPQTTIPAQEIPLAPLDSLPAAPVETTPVEEMPPQQAPPAEPKPEEAEDMFDTPPADPAPAPEPTPPAEEPQTEEPEEQEAPPAAEQDPLEDFFNAVPRPSTLEVAGGLESDSHRTWIDNTGKYRCEARLVTVTQHEVVLAKTDGKLKTVSLRRLSDTDLQFVHTQVVAKRESLALPTADEKLASHWAE